VELKLTLSLVFDRPTDSKLKPTDNFARKIFGQIGIFPCHPASRTSLEIWKNGKWAEVDYKTINSLKVSDIPEGKESDLNLVFSPVKYMGGKRSHNVLNI
jgi:hypothetical protein